MPNTSAQVYLVGGMPGAGKSNTVVGFIVDAYKKDPNVKVYANFHLFGIKYVYCSVALMLKLYKEGILDDAILAIDEAYLVAEARRGGNPLTLLMTYLGMQSRKMKLTIYIISQSGRFIDWRIRLIKSHEIYCQKYNPKTHVITFSLKEIMSGREKNVSYFAPQYWCYYDTDEKLPPPAKLIDRAIKYVTNEPAKVEEEGAEVP